MSATAFITVISLLVAVWLPGRLRALGLQPGRRDSELDWAGMIGLLLGLFGVLLGLSGLAASAQVPAISKLVAALLRTLLSLTPALAILAGGAHLVAARRRAALSRKEEDEAVTEGVWIQRGAMLFAALSLLEMSLSLPALVLIVAAIGFWVYRNPGTRARMEHAWLEAKAGQALRARKLTAGSAVDDLLLLGPVGMFDTRIEGQEQPMANTALLKRAEA